MSEKKIITFKDFAEYLNRLSASHICPVCNCEEWDLHTPENAAVKGADGKIRKHIVPTLPGTPRIESDDAPQNQLFQSPELNILVMTCVNCGYINLFNYQRVQESIEEASKEKAKPESSDGSTTE
ncbi:hypothetical protein AB7W80_00240 [Providencia rettgeri]|uniref:hypothetical protein n=1 Tax=Providencia TaxID=586 RepID=UPI000197CB4D|nr:MULTISPECIES: hypothetical protein [Providencia]EFE55276.1 hypothetical protein PROVRETT_05985 [Providencia rettgeri DSM 1131]MBQ0532624.1 hypothetical protein [Providencia rettgeri]QXA59616.1 hypothetical protein I6L79_08960 [Providencia rettgeri]